MDKGSIKILLEFLIGIVLAFLILSNILGSLSWIVWIAAAAFLIYKLWKEGLDF